MTRHVTAAANTIQLDRAEAAGKLPKHPYSRADFGGGTLLHRPVTREPAGEEPVDVRMVNGRPVGGFVTAWPFARLPPAGGSWEADLITAVRLGERRRERAALEGLT